MAVRTAMEHPIGALPRTPFPASRDFPSRGNEKIGGTGYCVTYDTDSQSRNAPCVPFRGRGPRSGEGMYEGKNDYDTRCGRDRRRRHYKTHRREAAIPQPSGPKGPSNLRTLRPIRPVHLKNLPFEPSEPSEPGPRSGPFSPATKHRDI